MLFIFVLLRCWTVRRLAVRVATIEDFKFTVAILHQSRAAFDPIARVEIMNALKHAHFGCVNVAADHACALTACGITSDDAFEMTDEAGGLLDLTFDGSTKRPIA